MPLLSIHYLNKRWTAPTEEEGEVEITEAKGKGKEKAKVTCMRGCGAVENGEIEQPSGN
jgi:hypothetical protein